MSATAQLLEAVRKEARPGIWSTGVNLSRQGAVALQSQKPDEIELRVRAPGRPVAFTVTLYLKLEAWECDCPGRVDPCEHVVAAAITLQQAEKQDAPLEAAAQRWSRVVYHFTRVDGGLELHRVLVHADGKEEPLESLAAVLARPALAATLQVEQSDMNADRLLERRTRGALPPEKLEVLMRALEQARKVLLDGRPVAVSDEVVSPRALVEDKGGQIVVSVTRDPRVTEVVSAGVALCGDALARLGETAVTGAWLQNLPIVRTYAPEQMGEISSKVLPDLARRMPIEVRSKRLPSIDRDLKPRILMELTQMESGLSILPTLVYGAPPSVRIDAGRMVYLRGAVPLRDEAAEQRLLHQLRDELNLVPGRRVTVQGQEMVRWADRLRRWRGDLAGDAAGVVSPDTRLRPLLQVQSSGEGPGMPDVRFTLEFQVESGKGGTETRTVDAAAVIRAWTEGLGLVPLEGGGWAPLPRAWLDKNGQRVADLLAARQADGKVSNHALPELAALCQTLEQPPPPGLDRLAPLVEGFEKLPAPVLPEGLSATLRHYQLQGVSWLGFLRGAGLGGILADDMGLGKTLQTITVLGPRSLVVCPTSVLPNWAAELKRFRPSLKVNVYHGPGRALDESADVTLTTYSILRLDAAVLSGRTWDAAVLDEAQAIKNPESQVSRAAFGLQAKFRLALSGTPLENRLEELWSLMHFTNPGLLGGRRQFEEKTARPISEGNAEAAERLRKRIRPFVLRRLKRDVAPELPPRTESVMHVSLDERERAVYDAVMAATRTEVVALLNEGGSVLKALEALLRLRQAACHSALVPGQHAQSSSKVQTLVEALGTAVSEGHKALVFSQWTSLLDLLEPHMKSAGIAFERLDGSTPNRGEITSRFQSEDGAPVLLMSLKAGGTGLNLTAADHVFLMDPWWNPAVEAQAADRAHRIGQERPVMVYRLVSQGTVEERILGLQEKKRALFEAALSEASAATAITRDDLLALFS
jgi:superfamily II DNA or RNA helicase